MKNGPTNASRQGRGGRWRGRPAGTPTAHKWNDFSAAALSPHAGSAAPDVDISPTGIGRIYLHASVFLPAARVHCPVVAAFRRGDLDFLNFGLNARLLGGDLRGESSESLPCLAALHPLRMEQAHGKSSAAEYAQK